MKLSDYNYHLPDELIAQEPLEERDHSRLMVIDTATDTIEHKQFFDIVSLFKKGDVLVFNNSKVIPARLFAHKETGGRVEIFLVRQLGSDRWSALLKGIKEYEFGKPLIIADGFEAQPSHLITQGIWEVHFNLSGTALYDAIYAHGTTPLPPYIKKTSSLDRYQTVYAQHEGSVAAPTAGLHFTEQLLQQLREKGVEIHYVTLHVGPGTFSPIRDDDFLKHTMHAEWASVGHETADIINCAKREGRRIIAVGTTTVRTLESFGENGTLQSGERDTSIFIYPGYTFTIIDAMVTNFHLPQSSLLLLVCAFGEYKCSGGSDMILRAYNEAVAQRYRFFSFGDAMFIF